MDKDESKSPLKVLLAGGISSFTGVLIHQIAGLGLSITLARSLKVNEFGVLNLGLAIMVLMAHFSLLGLNQGMARFIPYFEGHGEKDKIRASVFLALKFSIVAIALGGLTVYGLSFPISKYAFASTTLEPVLKVLAFALPFFALSKFFNGGLCGFKRIDLMVITDNILWRAIPLLVLPLAFLVFPYRLLGAAYTFVFTALVMCIISCLFFFKELRSFPKISRCDHDCFRQIKSYSFPAALSVITNQLRERVDVFVIASFLGASQVGLFSVGFTMAYSLNLFLSSLMRIYNPVAAELHGQERMEQLGQIFSVVAQWLFALVFPATLLLLLFAEPLVTQFFGKSYATAASVLMILSICYFAKSAVGPAGSTLLALGLSKTAMTISIWSVVLNVVLAVVLIPNYGLIGAALSNGVAMVFQQFAMLFGVKKHIVVRLFDVKTLCYALYCVGLVLAVKMFLGEYFSSLTSLIVIIPMTYLCCLAGAFVGRKVESQKRRPGLGLLRR
jgi:O-antigen/teichoic acid export membrane protein